MGIVIKKVINENTLNTMIDILEKSQVSQENLFHNKQYFTKNTIKSHIKNDGVIFFYIKDEKPVGTVSLCHEKYNGKIQACTGLYNGYELRYVSVLPGYQGCGIAKELIADVKEYVDHKVIVVNTALNNSKAISLYERSGFQKVDVHYYNNHYVIDMIYGMDSVSKLNYFISCVSARMMKLKAIIRRKTR